MRREVALRESLALWRATGRKWLEMPVFSWPTIWELQLTSNFCRPGGGRGPIISLHQQVTKNLDTGSRWRPRSGRRYDRYFEVPIYCDREIPNYVLFKQRALSPTFLKGAKYCSALNIVSLEGFSVRNKMTANFSVCNMTHPNSIPAPR